METLLTLIFYIFLPALAIGFCLWLWEILELFLKERKRKQQLREIATRMIEGKTKEEVEEMITDLREGVEKFEQRVERANHD